MLVILSCVFKFLLFRLWGLVHSCSCLFSLWGLVHSCSCLCQSCLVYTKDCYFEFTPHLYVPLPPRSVHRDKSFIVLFSHVHSLISSFIFALQLLLSFNLSSLFSFIWSNILFDNDSFLRSASGYVSFMLSRLLFLSWQWDSLSIWTSDVCSSFVCSLKFKLAGDHKY